MNQSPHLSSPEANSELLLRSLASDMDAGMDTKMRVKKMIRSRLRQEHGMQAQETLRDLRELLTPDTNVSPRLWFSILSSITPRSSVWSGMRDALAPADMLREFLWQRISPRLASSHPRVTISWPMKWAAAFALVAFVVRASPMLFLAPPTIADSPVVVFASQGRVEALAGSFWQPISGELTLKSPTSLQTQDGAATIVLHDDAVIRLAPNTEVALYDISDRPEASTQSATLRLVHGQIWVLGLVPKHVRGLTVLTSQGRVSVHEGSVSVSEGKEVAVTVWDRSALVSRRGKHITLFAGGHTILQEGDLVATSMQTSAFQNDWVAGNLSRDASHRRDIAELQQERRAASAGILPGSKFYQVKRLAEAVDVLLTFSQEDRAKKLVTQANTRLNEAAALLQTGDESQAGTALQEYKDTVLQAASGSGGNIAVQQLLQKEVVEAGAATVSAALPGDQAYALKQTVDDAIASLPVGVSKPDVEGEMLLDELASVKRQAQEGDTAQAKERLVELTDSIASLDTTGALSLISRESRDEAKIAAEQLTATVAGPTEGILQLGRPEKAVLLPRRVREMLARPLTPEQVAAKAQEIRGHIFVFGTKKAQYNALEDRLRLISQHADRGRILRALLTVLPSNGLSQRVAREIRTVQQEVAEQQMMERVTASGGTAAY